MSTSLAIVIPLYNEEKGIVELLSRLQASVSENFLLMFVDDGSTDNTVEEIKRFSFRVGIEWEIARLSRNFGHQAALMCGLRLIGGRAERIVVMDGDLQDQPEDVPRLLTALTPSYDCAYAERLPASKSFLIDQLTGIFYRLQELTVPFPVPRYAGTFSAFRKEFLGYICNFSESDLYFPGIRAYIGFKQTSVPVHRGCRKHGASRVGFMGLVRLSSSGILGFSALPLRMIFLCGLVMFASSILIGPLVLILRLTGIIDVMGFTSLMLILLAFGGIQMMSLGILGEYLSKLFTDVKRRPEAIVGSTVKGEARVS